MGPEQMAASEPADLDLQCFQKWINPSSAGQWLIISTHAANAMVNVLILQTFKLPAKKAKPNSADPDQGLPCLLF